MQKIFITGATSFIGRNLLKQLVEKEYKIIAIVREKSPNIDKLPKSTKIEVIECNMDNIKNLNNISDPTGDVFIHLAWDGTRGVERDDKFVQEKNYLNSIEAIKVAHDLGCKTFVGAGSQAEYGPQQTATTELTQCTPVTEYGKIKLRVCLNGHKTCMNYDIKFIWPRFFSLYGKDDYEGSLIISTIDKILRNETVELTKCTQMWNFLHIDDAVNGIIKLIEIDSLTGIYNFGSEETKPLKSFVHQISENIETDKKVLFGAIPYPKSGIVSVQPNTDKLKKETGWKQVIQFEEGIKDVIKERKKALGVKI